MSRIGNAPVSLPAGVTFKTERGELVVSGPKGEVRRPLPHGITVALEENMGKVRAKGEGRKIRALHGLVRAQLANDIQGVSTGWSKTLELSGVGFRAAISGKDLVLNVGFSHPVTITPPEGITFTAQEGKVVVSGIDKNLVGQIAANVRAVKKPEPYKGKGIKYQGEYIRKKAGKAAKAIGGAPGGTK